VGTTTKLQYSIYECYEDREQCVARLKRLEKGTFSWPKPGQADSPKLKLTPEAFAMLTDGVDLRGAQMRPWYERE
jgi:hypothetical protein